MSCRRAEGREGSLLFGFCLAGVRALLQLVGLASLARLCLQERGFPGELRWEINWRSRPLSLVSDSSLCIWEIYTAGGVYLCDSERLGCSSSSRAGSGPPRAVTVACAPGPWPGSRSWASLLPHTQLGRFSSLSRDSSQPGLPLPLSQQPSLTAGHHFQRRWADSGLGEAVQPRQPPHLAGARPRTRIPPPQSLTWRPFPALATCPEPALTASFPARKEQPRVGRRHRRPRTPASACLPAWEGPRAWLRTAAQQEEPVSERLVQLFQPLPGPPHARVPQAPRSPGCHHRRSHTKFSLLPSRCSWGLRAGPRPQPCAQGSSP